MLFCTARPADIDLPDGHLLADTKGHPTVVRRSITASRADGPVLDLPAARRELDVRSNGVVVASGTLEEQFDPVMPISRLIPEQVGRGCVIRNHDVDMSIVVQIAKS